MSTNLSERDRKDTSGIRVDLEKEIYPRFAERAVKGDDGRGRADDGLS